MLIGAKELYQRFFEFSVDSFEKYIYLFYFNELNCSPQLLQKLKNEEDTIQRNNFLVLVFGPSAARCLK